MDLMFVGLSYIIGVPLLALILSVVTLCLGKMFDSFEVSGDGGFKKFYLQFMIVSAVYVTVDLLNINALIGFFLICVAYKYVFDAGWWQAAVIGFCANLLAIAVLAGLLVAAVATGLITA